MLHILIPTTPARRARLDLCIENIRDNVKTPHTITTFENELGGFVPAIHEMLKDIHGTVWAIGDDTVVLDNGAVDLLYKTYIERYPEKDGVVQPDDGILHGTVITMPMCDARTLQKYTYKGYNHWYADCEFTDIMAELGKYTYVPEALVEHHHWVNGKVPKDFTYEKYICKNAQDEQLYRERKRNNFEPKND